MVFPAFVVPDVLEVGQHLLGGHLDVRDSQFLRNRTELVEDHQVSDVERLDDFLELFGDLARRAGNDVAFADQVIPGDFGVGLGLDHLLGGFLALELVRVAKDGLETLTASEALLNGAHGAVAGRVGVARVDVQHLVVEVLGVRSELVGDFLLGLADGDELEETGVVRVERLLALLHRSPETVHVLLTGLVATVGEVAVDVVVVGAPLPRLNRAATGDPDWRVRVLERSRPDVDVTELVVATVVGEHLRSRPGLRDHIGGLVVLVAQVRRVGAVAEAVVHRRTNGEAGDQATAGDAVEHGELFGHTGRRVVERDRVTEHHDGDILGAAAEVGSHQVRRRHQTVGVLVVLVDADAVIAGGSGGFELVQAVVVHLVGFGRVEQLRVDVNPDRVVRLGEVRREISVRHQMEEFKFHRQLRSVPSSGWCEDDHARSAPIRQAVSVARY